MRQRKVEKGWGRRGSQRDWKPAKASTHHCWLWRWRKEAMSLLMQAASRNREQPPANSQQGNGALNPTTAWNWILKTICKSLEVNPFPELQKETQFCVCVRRLVVSDPIDCSWPDSSVHGILQARILEWITIPSSRGSSPSRDQTQVSCIAGRFFIIWATRAALVRAWFSAWSREPAGSHSAGASNLQKCETQVLINVCCFKMLNLRGGGKMLHSF